MDDNTLYDLLTGVKIDDLQCAQLNTATERTFIDPATAPFWSPVILLAHVLKSSRCYPYGLPIPESGAVWTEEIANGASASVQPPGTEIWRVEGIDIDSCSVGFYDGTTVCGIDSTQNTPPYFITNTNYLILNNASGSAKNPDVAYSKVGL